MRGESLIPNTLFLFFKIFIFLLLFLCLCLCLSLLFFYRFSFAFFFRRRMQKRNGRLLVDVLCLLSPRISLSSSFFLGVLVVLGTFHLFFSFCLFFLLSSQTALRELQQQPSSSPPSFASSFPASSPSSSQLPSRILHVEFQLAWLGYVTAAVIGGQSYSSSVARFSLGINPVGTQQDQLDAELCARMFSLVKIIDYRLTIQVCVFLLCCRIVAIFIWLLSLSLCFL